MLKAITENGELVNVKASTDGKLIIDAEKEANTEVETTLRSSLETVGTNVTNININKKVTSIDVANYSETANITVTIGALSAAIGPTIATSLLVNKDTTKISLVSTEADTKVQLIVRGVE